MSDKANPSMTNRQRVFVALLLLFGALLAFAAIQFMSPGDALNARHGGSAAAKDQAAPRSVRQ